MVKLGKVVSQTPKTFPTIPCNGKVGNDKTINRNGRKNVDICVRVCGFVFSRTKLFGQKIM